MLEYCGEDGEICVDTMVGEWLIFFEEDPESAPALDELWPNVPDEILDEVRRRLAGIDSVAGFFSSGSYNPDSEMIDLSVLKPGYRPIPGAAYELVERLDDDNSGFGAVWRGRNDRLQKDVVFKFCKEPLNESSSQTLHNELRLVRELDHPSIVKLQDECLDAKIPFLIYECIDGVDLSKLLAERFAEGKSMPPDEAAGVILKIADIVSHAHTRSKPIVHRDLKPQNILVANHHDLALLSVLNVTPDLRLADLKVMDFGIGGHCSEGKTNQSMFSSLGANFDGFATRLYGSPQQCEGLRAERSDDVYALGVIWYQLLVGSMKKAPTGSGWRRGLVAKGMSNEQIDVLERCLEQERENRITDGVELLKQIRTAYPLVGSCKNYLTVLTEAAMNAGDVFGWDEFDWDEEPYPRLGCLSSHVAEVLSSIEDKYNFLDWFESLSLQAAAVVASWDGERLSLGSLKILTEEAAATLAGWNGVTLSFRSLNSLTPETANALSSWKGRNLRFHGLINLTPETANALSSWNGQFLYLGSLTNMTPETASALASWEGSMLSLNGLQSLTPETAAALACWKGSRLSLDGLESLTPETAAALASWEVEILSLDGLESLTPETAAALVSWEGCELHLNGLKSLSYETAAALASWQGEVLSLDGLESLTPETAAALASYKGKILRLNGLKSLSSETAAALASWEVEILSLDGLESLTPETAAALVSWEGNSLSLNGLESLTPETAAALASWNGRKLELIALSSLTPKSADALAHWKGENFYFNFSSKHDKALIGLRSANGDSLLHIAAEHGGYAMAAFLIKIKAEVDIENKKGRRPLFFAVKKSHKKIAELLIKNGADVNQTWTEEKDTPLHLAAKNGNAELVEILLHAGVDCGAKNARGEMAIHCAVESGNIDTIRLLVPKS